MAVVDELIVLGAGHAGVELAMQAREAGWPGPITLIGDEVPLPYQRPALSKAWLAGTASLESMALKARETYQKAGIELLLGQQVKQIDRVNQRLVFADGATRCYARLALATGGRARALPAAGTGAEAADNFHYLRTLADVDRIRQRFVPGARLVVVGGGYVGLEVAAVAIKLGLSITVLEAAPRVLARVTAPELSTLYERVHREAGVDVRTGVQVDGFEIDAARNLVVSVHCDDGQTFVCDLVIAGIGLLPNTELAAAAGLEVNDGILVDASSRTSDEHIVAAGDCTRHHSALYGRSIRLESVPNALEQARCAAAFLCGKRRLNDSAPWFWSDQYELKLKMVGLSQGYDRLLIRGSLEECSLSAFYLQGQRVLAVDTVNRPSEFMVAKRLVAERIEVNLEQLVDDKVPLKSLLPTT